MYIIIELTCCHTLTAHVASLTNFLRIGRRGIVFDPIQHSTISPWVRITYYFWRFDQSEASIQSRDCKPRPL